MKRFFALLLAALTIFTLAACGKSDVAKELEDIEDILGNLANDYLSAEVTGDEAIEKLDILEARAEALEDEATDLEEWDVSAVETKISLFKFNIDDGEIDDIQEIKEKYYEE
ncbi:MAG: hypothetical protein LUC25_01825 [Ruminococcus sp.]|nr:hypothetical protein [Ruminococcus sp.]